MTENNLEMPAEMKESFLAIGTCPVSTTIGIIGGKWKVIILYLISYDICRFSHIHKLIDGISKKTLAEQLKELENDGIILRKAFPEVPPRVEYSLTAKGLTLRPIIFSMRDWGIKFG
ncbi:winged helix-turn-helix transcriptional regulator [Dyadobacter arcticus]|uniref:DNA-binding HxlR family transcriptional regulator n=1 Tax=Dyadobacter arcticus TaxID=1078754 RepID=A0ABX0UHY8_9BACT|nr:helix-turn-helix domain-containing protein [Dyadobacter arcticus]NIJ52638.1 DNA-binding HxlR family transcriptional regulator [Dyadobacter arcticus]